MGPAAAPPITRHGEGSLKRLLAALLLCLTLGLAAAYRERTELLDRLDLETRHRLVALMSQLTARRPDTADGVVVTPRVDNPLGINTFLEQDVTLEARRRSLEMIREAGYGWIRQQFPWSSIEPVRKGRFVDRVMFVNTWAVYDSIVDLARANDLRVIARLDTSPPWARAGNDWSFTPPDNVDDFG